MLIRPYTWQHKELTGRNTRPASDDDWPGAAGRNDWRKSPTLGRRQLEGHWMWLSLAFAGASMCDIEGDDNLGRNVTQILNIIQRMQHFGRTAVIAAAGKLRGIAGCILQMLSNLSLGGIPTIVDEVPDDSPEVQDDDDIGIAEEIQDEGESDGVVVECIGTPEEDTTAHRNHWGPNGEYVPETRAIIDRFAERNTTRDRRTEPLLWAELFECGLVAATWRGEEGC